MAQPIPKPRPQLLSTFKIACVHGTRKFISKSCALGGRSRENTLTIPIFNRHFFLIERSCDITLGNFSQVLNSGYVLTEVPDKSCANTKTISNMCHIINLSGLMGNFLFYVIPTISETLFTWSGGPRSSGVGFFCFHALEDTKQKKLTPLDRAPPLHVNRVFCWRER